MKRNEFTSLPLSIALGLLWDHVPGLESILLREHMPSVPSAPRFDRAMYRKDGVTYASETSLESLRYWHKRAQDGAESGGQYAEKDKKQAAALELWINWRLIEPSTTWSGKRGDEQITAAPPSDRPAVYDRQPRAPGKAREDRKPMSFDEEEKAADAFGDSEEPPF